MAKLLEHCLTLPELRESLVCYLGGTITIGELNEVLSVYNDGEQPIEEECAPAFDCAMLVMACWRRGALDEEGVRAALRNEVRRHEENVYGAGS